VSTSREYGLDRGKVFPAANAKSLLNPLRRLVQSPRRTVASVGLDPDSRVLELGCGPGFFSPYLAQAVPAGQLVLADLQAEMLLLARERVSSERHPWFVQADGSVLPIAAGSLDAVFIATVLGEIPDPAACVADVHRVLRQNGSLAIAETRRDSDFIPLPKLRDLVEPHGFVFAGRRGMQWQYVARFTRS
jgi:ubiquinone/menaquinone biosynthesis C-methylase UbiE